MTQATHGARPLETLSRVLESVDSTRTGRAVQALMTIFAAAGLLLAMAESSLGRGAVACGIAWGAAALTAPVYLRSLLG